MTLRKVLIVLALGGLGTAISARALAESARASLELATTAATTSAIVGAIGVLVLRLLERRSLTTQLSVVTLSTIGSVAAGAITTRAANPETADAVAALAVVLFSSGTIGALVGLYLGHKVAEGSAELTVAARQLGLGERPGPVSAPPTEELAELAHELELTSQRLDESTARSSALEDSRRDLVAWVSHDLRTPLSRIRAVVEALEDDVVSDPETVSEYHTRIQLETERLSRLIDSLLELNQLRARALRLELRPTLLSDVASDLVAAFAPVAAARDVRVQASVHGSSPIVEASSEHLERALSNLVDNAIRYSERGSRIQIDVGTTEESAYFVVQDGCGGMTPAELASLFEPTAARARARRSNSGSGLGLVIASELIQAHHGSIGVENTTGGCRVRVSLPVASASS